MRKVKFDDATIQLLQIDTSKSESPSSVAPDSPSNTGYGPNSASVGKIVTLTTPCGAFHRPAKAGRLIRSARRERQRNNIADNTTVSLNFDPTQLYLAYIPPASSERLLHSHWLLKTLKKCVTSLPKDEEFLLFLGVKPVPLSSDMLPTRRGGAATTLSSPPTGQKRTRNGSRTGLKGRKLKS